MAEEIVKTLGQQDGVQKALDAVATAGQDLLAGKPGSQENLAARARELVYASESPQNQAAWSFWAQPARTAAARIAIDLKLFETAISDDERPKSATELAAPTGASPKLTERIARMCVSMQFLDQKGPDQYVPNKMTHTLAQPEWRGGIVFHYDIVQLAFAKLPEFLRKTGFQNPEDPKAGAWPYANGVDYPFTDMNPKDNLPAFQAFHAYIHGSRKHQPHWTEIYPIADRLIEGLKPDGDSSAFIDVGGSMGSILQELQVRNPEYTGRLILQERAHVVELAKSRGLGADGRIEAQAHDFFTEQPVKGARAYYMRSVLHDWPDDKCLEILSHLKAVMEPGYSKILLNEYVVKDENPDWRPLSLDLLMMTLVSAHERSESEWKELIARAGLKIGGIFSKGEGCESVIELVL